jgi:hypothetical protein
VARHIHLHFSDSGKVAVRDSKSVPTVFRDMNENVKPGLPQSHHETLTGAGYAHMGGTRTNAGKSTGNYYQHQAGHYATVGHSGNFSHHQAVTKRSPGLTEHVYGKTTRGKSTAALQGAIKSAGPGHGSIKQMAQPNLHTV